MRKKQPVRRCESIISKYRANAKDLNTKIVALEQTLLEERKHMDGMIEQPTVYLQDCDLPAVKDIIIKYGKNTDFLPVVAHNRKEKKRHLTRRPSRLAPKSPDFQTGEMINQLNNLESVAESDMQKYSSVGRNSKSNVASEGNDSEVADFGLKLHAQGSTEQAPKDESYDMEEQLVAEQKMLTEKRPETEKRHKKLMQEKMLLEKVIEVEQKNDNAEKRSAIGVENDEIAKELPKGLQDTEIENGSANIEVKNKGMIFDAVAIADKEGKAKEDSKETMDEHTNNDTTHDAMDEDTEEIKIDHDIEIIPLVGARKDPLDNDASNAVDTRPPKRK